MSERRIPYFDFYPTDFMHGVRGLSAQEVGVYTMVLCRIYEENGPVEYNSMILATYCGMREATFVKTLEKLVCLDKFQVDNGMISNRRAMAEISSRANKLKLNSKAGKASAQKRQQKQSGEPTDVQRTFNHTDTDTDKKQEPTGSSKKRGTRLPGDFSPDMVAAVEAGLSEAEAQREALKFRDYWISQPGQKGVKLDWPATWRNWCRHAVERRPHHRTTGPPKKTTLASMWTEEAIALGIIDEPASPSDRFLDAGHARGQGQGPDFTPRIAGT
ncbi:hypothetical protein ASD64_01415 [Mesorhizobium sp. Root157]|uniref:DUF1376 domain-containing protein n=1 Tax=Mesorhizobium sp. Root157 TaxID=1736477 RepID=UPI0006F43041|nr:DUF1376 domain-containing protein [Mesorhizobium sp. Root157]KRA00260.1 hypothetical protein ASD64_01415 [Mesorhizobium sp. Root157]